MSTYLEREINEEIKKLESLTGIEFIRSNMGNIKSIRRKGYSVSMIRGANLDMLHKNLRSINDLIKAALDNNRG
jgi:hypothetical protein